MFVFIPETLSENSRYGVSEGAFNKEECEKICEIPKSELEDSKIIDSKNEMVRNSKTSWIYYTPEQDWLFQRIYGLAKTANHGYRFDLNGLYEPLQFTHYGLNQYYEWHQDFGPDMFSLRKLSIVVMLDDPSSYEGGELEIFGIPKLSNIPQGTAIIFPSWEQHRVLPVVSGVRRTLVTWVSGPPFR